MNMVVWLSAGEAETLRHLLEKEIMAQPNSAMVEGKPSASGQYAAYLENLRKKLATE